MCLDFIDEAIRIPKQNIGYKIFLVLDDKLFHSTVYYRKSLPLDKLLWEYNYRPLGFWFSLLLSNKLFCEYTRDKYNTGFHIFINKVDAFKELKNYKTNMFIKYAVYKVKYNVVVAKGYQHKKKVVVCKYMKILNKVRSK